MDGNCDSNKKRVRADSDDSDANSDELKRVRANTDGFRPVRIDSDANSAESDLDSPGARLFQDDLLNIFEETELAPERDPAIQGLDSVIRSFEEEIQVRDPAAPEAMHVTTDSGESQQELGYLLEASDDELGLPPTGGSVEEEGKIEAVDFERSSFDAVGFDGMLLFGDEIPSYDSFGFGIGTESNGVGGESEYVALGGLFDGWDGSYESGAVSEVLWRTETLPAM
ncbi:hypothetical protein PanWU01x14_325240 [Parasponia andersonii]|uniref:Uncharacterized protein n=1 Tax=Parasponia andersonii TaxID=3476 RepID=A0A2P5AJV3_PARAD|nr:hypothetical protein PanWU01x14_325240 [Parasponia andersonii]